MKEFFKKHIKTILYVLGFIVSAGINFGAGILLIDRADVKETAVYFLVFAVISAVSLAVSFALIHFCKIKLHILTFVCVLLLGGVYMSVFTPNTVPDEPVHYHSAYYYSNYFTFNFKANNQPDGNIMMRSEDNTLISSFTRTAAIEEYNRLRSYDSLLCKEKQMVPTGYSPITSKPLAYIPAGLGIAFARWFGLSAPIAYYMGRAFNLLFAALMLMFVVKVMPFAKRMVFCIALLPMSLHLFASYSYDVFSIVTVLLMFSYIFKLMYAQKGSIGIKQLSIAAALIFLAVPYKVVYIFVAALVLLVPKENFKQPKYHFGFKVLLGVIAVASILVSQFAYVDRLTTSETSILKEPGYTLADIISSPFHILSLVATTLFSSADHYLGSLIGGSLGWFQTSTPFVIILPFIFALLIGFLQREDEPSPLKPLPKLYSLVMFIGVVISTMLLLLIDFTPKSATGIIGVQGRYFIAALPALFLAVRNKFITIKKFEEKDLLAVLILLNHLFLSVQVFEILVMKVVNPTV